ncbi:MAG: hypothetical protein IPN42_09025 [Methylococcaceae bacterium]|nr:hypothetical protein [Methylococcaceae bacterium]
MENNFISNYLQETKNLIGLIENSRHLSNFTSSIDIVLCRLYDHYLNKGHTKSLFDVIEKSFGRDVINAYLVDIGTDDKNQFEAPLKNQETYNNAGTWNKFLKNGNLIADSERCLNAYYDWWILGHNKETSDPDVRMAETGVMDPIANTPKYEWKKFYRAFPVVFFHCHI